MYARSICAQYCGGDSATPAACQGSGNSGTGCQGPPGPPGPPGAPGSGGGSGVAPLGAYQRCYNDYANVPPEAADDWGLAAITNNVCVVWKLADETQVYVIPKSGNVPLIFDVPYQYMGNLETTTALSEADRQAALAVCQQEINANSGRFARAPMLLDPNDNTSEICASLDKLTGRWWDTDANIGTGVVQDPVCWACAIAPGNSEVNCVGGVGNTKYTPYTACSQSDPLGIAYAQSNVVETKYCFVMC